MKKTLKIFHKITIKFSSETYMIKINADAVLEFVIVGALLTVWSSFTFADYSFSTFAKVIQSPNLDGKESLEIPQASRIMFLVGMCVFIFSSLTRLYRYQGKDKFTWTTLLVGIILSMQIPVVLRSWFFRFL